MCNYVSYSSSLTCNDEAREKLVDSQNFDTNSFVGRNKKHREYPSSSANNQHWLHQLNEQSSTTLLDDLHLSSIRKIIEKEVQSGNHQIYLKHCKELLFSSEHFRLYR
jgi:hypothetical protein